MRRRLALLAGLLVLAGCGGEASPQKVDATPTVTHTASAAPGVSTAPPTVAYLLKGRVHVGGRELPGRFGSVLTRGAAWLALPGEPGAALQWGVGAASHTLSPGLRAELSPNGRYLATARDESCQGNAPGATTCEVGLLDTAGARPPRRIVLRHAVDLRGVTDDGVVVVREQSPGRWGHLVWDAAAGANTAVPVVEIGVMSGWAMNDWDVGVDHAGVTVGDANVPGHWLGEIVDGAIRRGRRIPEGAEPGPHGTWWLGTTWSQRSGEGPFATTRTLEARKAAVAPRVRLRAPAGWRFAEASYAGLVVWEDADTFLARVVDSRYGGDRLVRCDIRLATCVMVEE